MTAQREQRREQGKALVVTRLPSWAGEGRGLGDGASRGGSRAAPWAAPLLSRSLSCGRDLGFGSGRRAGFAQSMHARHHWMKITWTKFGPGGHWDWHPRPSLRPAARAGPDCICVLGQLCWGLHLCFGTTLDQIFLYYYIIKASPRLTLYCLKDKKGAGHLTPPYHLKNYVP
jgi:hypothetical protein